MRLGKEIKDNIENLWSELRWLEKEIKSQQDEEDVDFETINSRFEDLEQAVENISTNTTDLLGMLEELF